MIDGGSYGDRWAGRLKAFGALVLIALAVAFAMVVGNRLSDEALSVLAGAVCGVGAAIPTSLIILSATRRHNRPHERPAPQATRQTAACPPVVVVAPQATQQHPGGWTALPSPLSGPATRRFTVVGGSPIDQEVMADERGY
jgi:hypothetical protein